MTRTLFQNPWARCACGHMWLVHDVEEYHGDGTDRCCRSDCDQSGCPGSRDEIPPELTEGDH